MFVHQPETTGIATTEQVKVLTTCFLLEKYAVYSQDHQQNHRDVGVEISCSWDN